MSCYRNPGENRLNFREFFDKICLNKLLGESFWRVVKYYESNLLKNLGLITNINNEESFGIILANYDEIQKSKFLVAEKKKFVPLPPKSHVNQFFNSTI